MTNIDTIAIRQTYTISQFVACDDTRRWSGMPCPKCGGKNRFTIKRVGNEEAFHCRNCHDTYGDVIDFARWLGGLSFTEACNWIIGNPAPTPLPAASKKRFAPSEHKPLRDGHWYRNPHTLPMWRQYKPLSAKTISAARLGYGRIPRSRARHYRLLLPVYAADGTLLQVRGRACDPSDPHEKWLASGGWDYQRLPLYGAESIVAGQPLTMCENPVDALLAAQDGIPCVATFATGYWPDAWPSVIRAAAPSIVLVAGDRGDADGAGDKMTERNVGRLMAEGIAAAPFDWPDGFTDFGEWLMSS